MPQITSWLALLAILTAIAPAVLGLMVTRALSARHVRHRMQRHAPPSRRSIPAALRRIEDGVVGVALGGCGTVLLIGVACGQAQQHAPPWKVALAALCMMIGCLHWVSLARRLWELHPAPLTAGDPGIVMALSAAYDLEKQNLNVRGLALLTYALALRSGLMFLGTFGGAR